MSDLANQTARLTAPVSRRELHITRADERPGLLYQGGDLQDRQGELGEPVDPVGADPGIAITAPPDVAGVLRDVVLETHMEPAGPDLGQVLLDHLDLAADVGG